METLLSLLIAVVRALFGADEAAMVEGAVEMTTNRLSAIGITLIHTRLSWLMRENPEDRPNTMRLLRNGAVVIGSSGVNVPDDLVGISEVLGTTSDAGSEGKSPVPSLGALAWAYLKNQRSVIRSRMTFFNKSIKNAAVFDLRVQTNLVAPVPQDVVPNNLTMVGDPVKYTLTLFDKNVIRNFSQLRANISQLVGWTLVLQARLVPVYNDNGTWRQSDPSDGKSDKGAWVDWHNAVSRSTMNAWIMNCSDYILWLVPPENDFVTTSLALEHMGKSNIQTVVFGTELDVETPPMEEKPIKTNFLADMAFE